jgi:hypothetical protein
LVNEMTTCEGLDYAQMNARQLEHVWRMHKQCMRGRTYVSCHLRVPTCKRMPEYDMQTHARACYANTAMYVCSRQCTWRNIMHHRKLVCPQHEGKR